MSKIDRLIDSVYLLGLLLFIIYLIVLLIDKIYPNAADKWAAYSLLFVATTAIGGILLFLATAVSTMKTRDMATEMKRQREILEKPAVSVRIVQILSTGIF